MSKTLSSSILCGHSHATCKPSMHQLISFTKREGLQCPLCIGYSSHRAPTCKNHEKMIKEDDIAEVNDIVYKYNHDDMSRYCANQALEMLLAPVLGNSLVGIRVTVNHDGCTEYPKGVYDGTVVEYNPCTRLYIVEYDSGCGSAKVDVFELLEVAKEMYKGYVEDYIESFGVEEC